MIVMKLIEWSLRMEALVEVEVGVLEQVLEDRPQLAKFLFHQLELQAAES